jgi:redox-sensing transcriptional repressor
MTTPIPVPTLRRLPLYLRLLESWRAAGRATVSCTHLAEALDLDPTQVRKDLAVCGVPGRPKVGYDLPDLAAGVSRFLGWENPGDAFLVGAGPLGRALLAYEGFAARGLAIVGAFDPDPAMAGRSVDGHTVMPMHKLPDLTRRMGVRLGVLAVPQAAASVCVRAMAAAGISGVWSFVPVPPADTAGLVIEHVDLAQSLAVLSHRLINSRPPPPRTS